MARGGRLWRAGRGLAVNYAFEAIGLVLGITSVPWLLAHLGPVGYGEYLTLQSLSSMLGLAEFGAVGATLTWVARASSAKERTAPAPIFRRALLVGVGSAALLVMGLTLAGPRLLQVVGLDADRPTSGPLLAAVCAVAALGFLLPLSLTLHNGLQDLARAAVVNGLVRLTSVIAACWAAWRWQDVISVLWATAAVSTFGVAAGLVDAHRRHGAFERPRDGLSLRAIATQWRGGWDYFVLGLANASSASAPTLAISSTLGPGAVPAFAVPWRLATMGLGLVVNFSAVLVPGLAEAWARGDRAWTLALVDRLLRAFAVVSGVGVALLAVSGPSFVAWWTLGRVTVSTGVALSAGVAAAAWALLALLRFTLASVGARRSMTTTELVAGLTAFVLAVAAAAAWGQAGVGGALALGLGATGGRWLAAALREALGVARLAPPWRTWGVFAAAFGSAAALASGLEWATNSLGPGVSWLLGACSGGAGGIWVGLSLSGWRRPGAAPGLDVPPAGPAPAPGASP